MAANLIYVDLANGKAVRNASGDTFAFPDLVAGGNVTYAMRFLEYANGYLEKDQKIARIRVSLGPKDGKPKSGRYKISIGGHVTDFIDFSADAHTIAAALNAVSDVGQITCDAVDGGVLIRGVNGRELELSVVANTLYPVCFGNITSARVGAEWVYELRLQQAPYAFSDSANRILPDPPTITTIQNGGEDPSGTVIWNEIQSLYIPPTFRGTYQLRRYYGKTELFDITSTVADIQAGLNKLLATEGGSCVVTNPTTDTAHIEFKGELAGTDVTPLIVQVYSAPLGDYTFTLDLNTAELRAAFRSSDKISLPFEAEADFYIDPNNTQAGTIPRKLWSTTVNVYRPLIFPALASVQSIDWLTPPSPVDYTPFSPDQIITGQQFYTCTVGNGTATSFVIAHNLNSDSIASVLVRSNSDPGEVLTAPADYSYSIDSRNAISVIFTSAPAPNSVAIIITAAGPASVFQAHTHTISQIVDLSDQLDYLGSKVAYLLSLVPTATIAPVNNNQPNATSSVASFGEILPDASLEDSTLSISAQVIPSSGGAAPTAVPGTDLQEQLATNAAALAALKAQLASAQKAIADATASGATVDQAKQIASKTTFAKMIVTTLSSPSVGSATAPMVWPPMIYNRIPTLFRALSGNSIDYSGTTPPSAQNSAGIVYKATSGLTLSLGGGRKNQVIPANGYFAGDGKTFYRVYQGGDNLWHPWEMDRELSRFVISSDAFPAGGTLEYSWSTIASLLPDQFDTTLSKADLFARYSMQVCAIPASPSGVTEPLVLASLPLNFSEAQETRNFTLSITRPDNSGSSSEAFLTSYGVKYPIAPLPWGDVVLSISLREFETDVNSSSVGQLSLYVPSSQLTISK